MNITIPSSNIAQKRVFTDLSHNFIAQCSTCHGCLHGLRCLSNPCFSYLCACALVENRMNKHTKCMYMYIYIYIYYYILYIIYYILYIIFIIYYILWIIYYIILYYIYILLSVCVCGVSIERSICILNCALRVCTIRIFIILFMPLFMSYNMHSISMRTFIGGEGRACHCKCPPPNKSSII